MVVGTIANLKTVEVDTGYSKGVERHLSLTSKGAFLYVLGMTVFASGLYINPIYQVWSQGLVGQAQLAKAEQNRQITIQEAKATEEAAEYLAKAEIARARGVAEANTIVADGLGGYEGYLRYLYIEGLKQAEANGDKVIYIPTEAGLPILEANRLN